MRTLMLAPLLMLLGTGARAQECVRALPAARVIVGVRTVLLRAEDGTEVTYERATGAWRRTAAPHALAPARDPLECPAPADSIIVAPGVRLVARDSVVAGARWLIHDDAAAQPIPVRIAAWRRPQPPVRRPADEPEAGEEEPTEFSPYVSSWLRDGGLVWLGLYGSDTDAGNFLGGLLRYSLRTHTLTSFAPETLRDVLIPSMAVAGGSLWLATQRRVREERGPGVYAGVGLLRLGRDGRFQGFSETTSPLPSDLIGAIAGSGDSLWVVTDAGVAMLDTRTMTWDRRFFKQIFTLDSTYIALVKENGGSTTEERAREMIFVLMDLLGMPRGDRAAFLETASKLDPEELQTLRQSWGWLQAQTPDPVDEFALIDGPSLAEHPTLLPFVRRALRAGGSWDLPSAILRAAESDSAWRRELREALQTAPRGSAAFIAGILVDSGDVTGLAWARQTLGDRALWADTTHNELGTSAIERLIAIAERHPDPATLPALLDLLPARPQDAPYLLRAIWALKDGTARAQAGRRVLGRPTLAREWLSFAADTTDPSRDVEPVLSARRDVAHAQLRYYLAHPDSLNVIAFDFSQIPDAVGTLVDIRDTSAPPLLLQLLALHNAPYAANDGLIALTGAQPPAPLNEPAQLLSFWTPWWHAHAAGFTPVPRAAGEAALKAWRERVRRATHAVP